MIELKNKIFITGASTTEVARMKRDLSLLNPAFDKSVQMNLSTWDIPRTLQYYTYDGTTFEAPIGYISNVPTGHVIKDSRTSVGKNKFIFKGKLRPYQDKVKDAVLKNEIGTVCAPTGSGKTTIMCAAISARSVNTLILVNTLELAQQFTDRIKQFIGGFGTIGLLGNAEWDIQPITVGILQTLAKRDLTELNKYFGAVFFDETHLAGASTYFDVMSRLMCKYKYGFSATPERTDGLTEVIFLANGPLIYEVNIDDIREHLLTPDYIAYDTNYMFPLFDASEYQQMISNLSADVDRNQLILEKCKEYPTQQIALLCQRKEQVELLHKAIPKSVILTSSTPKKKRKEIMEGLRSGAHRIIISTYQLFATGIDLDTLEVLFMCAPIKSKILVKQTAGRLMRIATSIKKNPIIVDFIDRRVELLKHQYYTRSRILKNL